MNITCSYAESLVEVLCVCVFVCFLGNQPAALWLDRLLKARPSVTVWACSTKCWASNDQMKGAKCEASLSLKWFLHTLDFDLTSTQAVFDGARCSEHCEAALKNMKYIIFFSAGRVWAKCLVFHLDYMNWLYLHWAVCILSLYVLNPTHCTTMW